MVASSLSIIDPAVTSVSWLMDSIRMHLGNSLTFLRFMNVCAPLREPKNSGSSRFA